MNHLGGLGVGDGTLGADGVEIALNKLAKPPLRRPLTPEHRADRITLERDAELVDMLGDKTRQRNRQVESKRELARRSPLVGDVEDLP